MSGPGPGPDVVPVGFAATDGPGALLERRRSPGRWIPTAMVLVGAVVSAVSVWAMFRGATDVDARAVASGEVAALDGPDGEPARFIAERSQRVTVWLQTDGISTTGTREAVVAATACVARGSTGAVASFRGSRQGEAVTVNDRSTIGTFVAPAGEVEVSCRQVPFGRRRAYDRLRSERGFVVVPGSPGSGIWPILAVTGGMGLLIAGLLLRSRWQGGGVRRRASVG